MRCDNWLVVVFPLIFEKFPLIFEKIFWYIILQVEVQYLLVEEVLLLMCFETLIVDSRFLGCCCPCPPPAIKKYQDGKGQLQLQACQDFQVF